jgi:hypothetical protein
MQEVDSRRFKVESEEALKGNAVAILRILH